VTWQWYKGKLSCVRRVTMVTMSGGRKRRFEILYIRHVCVPENLCKVMFSGEKNIYLMFIFCIISWVVKVLKWVSENMCMHNNNQFHMTSYIIYCTSLKQTSLIILWLQHKTYLGKHWHVLLSMENKLGNISFIHKEKLFFSILQNGKSWF
jgi:hypothetical protein